MLEDSIHQHKTAAPDVTFSKENEGTASVDDTINDDIDDDIVDYVVDSSNEDGTQAKKSKYCGSIRGSRDVRETGIPFVVDKDCKCGKACLGFLRSGNIYIIFTKSWTFLNYQQFLKGKLNYDKAAEVLEPLRNKIHQQGFNSSAQQKEALRPLFESTIVGKSDDGRLKHNFEISGKKVCRGAWASAYNVSMARLDALADDYKDGNFIQ
jgi:hypothetical protein